LSKRSGRGQCSKGNSCWDGSVTCYMVADSWHCCITIGHRPATAMILDKSMCIPSHQGKTLIFSSQFLIHNTSTLFGFWWLWLFQFNGEWASHPLLSSIKIRHWYFLLSLINCDMYRSLFEFWWSRWI
jgi:hypothetical protein